MPKGIYERTDEGRASLSLAHLGRKGTKEAAGSYVDHYGYRVLTMQYDHPLATSVDRGSEVKEHRKVLYDKIGPGEHPCHWCGKILVWGGLDGICADHLDEDRLNNDPENLVPSCNTCNRSRGINADYCRKGGHQMTPDNVYVRPSGERNCRDCRRESQIALRERGR